ncbi:ACP S-malonyltransferase [Bacillus anthracis]|uniref:ACP S-malonyltransferase n=1 Tax=Bacillus anthracis TaxID=1392 RepID=UPI00099B6F5F|nr:ACP S-malonyltransferase [Bacillus anthracis]OPD59671.1 [acyl-carrier-protein] S-malonyltransferase [Bacillus anthracis]
MNQTVFLFSGQGSQYVGMGKKLFENYDEVKETFQTADKTLGFSLSDLCFSGNIQELTSTENAQPAILTLSIAQFNLFQKRVALKPSFLAGHSLGEITALTVAGVIEFSDALQIVRKRGQLMSETMSESKGSMSAISGVSIEMIEKVCIRCSNYDQIVVISNFNSPNQIVISGDEKAVKDAGQLLQESGATVIPLRVSAPFHSPLMKSAAEKFKKYLNNFNYYPLDFPVISNVTAKPYNNRFEVINTLAEQMVSPVQWTQTVRFLSEHDIKLAIEFGPQSILTNLMKQQYNEAESIAFDNNFEDVSFMQKIQQARGNLSLK